MKTFVVGVAILSACFMQEVNGGFLSATAKDKKEAVTQEADAKLHFMEHSNEKQKQQLTLDTKVDKKQDKVDDHWTPQGSWERQATEARDRATQDLEEEVRADERTWGDAQQPQDSRERGIGAQPTQELEREGRADERRWADARQPQDSWERGIGAQPTTQDVERVVAADERRQDSWERGLGAQPTQDIEREASADERKWDLARPRNEARVVERRWPDADPARRSGLTRRSRMSTRRSDMDRLLAVVDELGARAHQLDAEASQPGASHEVKEARDQALRDLEEADAYAQKKMYTQTPVNTNLMVAKAGGQDSEEDNEADEEEDMNNEANEEYNEDNEEDNGEDTEADEDDMDNVNEANEEDNEADEDNEEDNEADEQGSEKREQDGEEGLYKQILDEHADHDQV